MLRTFISTKSLPFPSFSVGESFSSHHFFWPQYWGFCSYWKNVSKCPRQIRYKTKTDPLIFLTSSCDPLRPVFVTLVSLGRLLSCGNRTGVTTSILCLRQEEHMLWQKTCRWYLLSLHSFMNVASSPVTLLRETSSSLKFIIPLISFFLRQPTAHFSVLKAQQKISVEGENKLLIYISVFFKLSSSYLGTLTNTHYLSKYQVSKI